MAGRGGLDLGFDAEEFIWTDDSGCKHVKLELVVDWLIKTTGMPNLQSIRQMLSQGVIIRLRKSCADAGVVIIFDQ